MVLALSAGAALKTWDGSASGNWATGANWSGGTAPVAGDDLVFPLGVVQLLVTNDFSPNRGFNSILFGGSNYVVRGNDILITNGITSTNPVGPNTIDATVEVRASQSWEAGGALAVLDVNGDIHLNASTLTVRANTGDFFFSGSLSGTGNLVKTNVGTLRFEGAGHNTYSGFTRLDGGVLDLNKFSVFPASNYVAVPGNLTIGDGNGLVGTDLCRLLADDQIANTSNVTIKNSGELDLNDHDDRIGPLTMQGGNIETGTGKLFLGGNLTTLSETNSAIINGNLSLGGASRTFQVNSGPPAVDLRINATLSSDTALIIDTAGFTKTGGGSLFLAGTNTYNGTTFVNEGQLAALTDGALGATASLLGPAPTVINGNGNLFLNGVQVTNENLTINSTNPGGAFLAGGASIWTGDIVLNTNTFVSSTVSLLLNGAISGAGGFTKLSAGSVTLAGTNANTYTGATIVRDGTLFLDKDTAIVSDGALSGPLVIGENELPENTDVVRYLRCCQLPDTTDVTIHSSGLLDVNGFGENVNDLIFNGGDVNAPSPGSLLPIGDITVNSSTNSQAVITGRLSVGGALTINVTGHFFSPDLRISAEVFGAGGLTKTGPGELSLTSSNVYGGTTTINQGLVQVENSFGLGTTSGPTVVHSGAVLGLIGNVQVPAEPLTLAGAGQGSLGALSSSFGSNSWAGAITLSADANVFVRTGDFLNLMGPIGGGFNLTKIGPGILIFSGGSANTFNHLFVAAGTLFLNKSIANAALGGDLIIGEGPGPDTIRLLNDNQIPDLSAVSMSAGALFELNNQNEQTGSIRGSGQIDLGTGTLRAGADNGSASFDGLIVGTGQLFKLGTGTWTLDGNNTYSGKTTVSAGTLRVNGAQPQSDVEVNGSATLGGDGIVGDLDVFGGLRPGSSPAILTTSNLVFRSGAADFSVELNGTSPGTGYDQVDARGTVALSNATLQVTLGFPSAISNSFTIINNDGADPVIGTFSGLAQGATLFLNGIPFRISYTGGTGNDVVLTQLFGSPLLTILRSGPTNVVLSWPTNFSSFNLESNTNLGSSFWTVVSPSPSVLGTNLVVTNAISGTQKLYRLHLP